MEDKEKEKKRKSKYYQDNRDKLLKKANKYHKDNRKEILEKRRQYHIDNREKILKRAKKYREDKKKGTFIPERVRVLGVRIKEKALKPFKRRISPGLLARMEENTRINNKKIKFYTVEETRDTYLVQNILKMKEMKI